MYRSTAAAITDLLLGLLLGALAVSLAADAVDIRAQRLQYDLSDWLGVIFAGSNGSLVRAASTCEEMGCLVVPFAYISVVVVTVVGVVAWRLNRSAHRQLSTGLRQPPAARRRSFSDRIRPSAAA